jgi:hypothetical protein
MAENLGATETLSQRRYRPGREFSYVLAIYNARADGKTKQTQLEIRTRILSSGRPVYDGKYHPVQIGEGSTPPSRIMTGGVMQLGTLGRGDYTLEVTARDKLAKKESRAVVRQEIDFSIE